MDKRGSTGTVKLETGPDNAITPPGSEETIGDSPIRERKINLAGVSPEVGIIQRVHVENFMCHPKFTINFYPNINFVCGQNGSGKSAILAAIQICLGAGARRTNRALNLKELVRKGATCTHTKIQVTLLNRGVDGYKPQIYGDTITVERRISKHSGGYSGYRLLDANLKERSRSKKHLDEMLDRLNIQVENPIAILDQEDSKLFLKGSANDKYSFFLKATELERIDRKYAATLDKLDEMDGKSNRMNSDLNADLQEMNALKTEWEKHHDIEKLKDELTTLYEAYGWASYQDSRRQFEREVEYMEKSQEKSKQKQLELNQAEDFLSCPDDEKAVLKAKLDTLIEEAHEQTKLKHDLEAKLKHANDPQRARERQLYELKKDLLSVSNNLRNAKERFEQKRQEIITQAGSAESEEAIRTESLKQLEDQLEAARVQQDQLKQEVTNLYRAYEELAPCVEQAKQNSKASTQVLHAVQSKAQSLESAIGGSLAVFGPRCTRMKQLVDQYQLQGKFSGPVVGPVGAHVKIVSGKEEFASIAESVLGFGTLDRFIVTNDRDRKMLQQIRKEAGCQQDCGIFQSHASARFNLPFPSIPGVETVASVLSITNDLVFNSLVDHCAIDVIALSKSKGESERLLLEPKSQGGYRIRGGIKEVYYLPMGDHWSVKQGNLAVISNERQMRQTIGVDRSSALADAKRELEVLRKELHELQQEENRMEHDHATLQKEWNAKKRAAQRNSNEIEGLILNITEMRAEQFSTVNFADTDTSEYEQDVAEVENLLEDMKYRESVLQDEIQQNVPEIQGIRAELGEVKIRNEKVLRDLKAAEDDLSECTRSMSQRLGKLRRNEKRFVNTNPLLFSRRKR